MIEEQIINYLGPNKIYKYIGRVMDIELKLDALSISHNRLIVNDIIYFVCPNGEDATVINDDKLSVFYISEGA